MTVLQVTEDGREPRVTPLFFGIHFDQLNVNNTLIFLGFMIVATLVTTLIARGISYR